ncbi:Uncharacterized protein Adt_37064 [Abeliophyllum distichum]|uniref:CASP-like protein n=1 Tax=Abeliophyllum distichum TaxID=126358 RepID=A0ABD1QJC1_9LAMI
MGNEKMKMSGQLVSEKPVSLSRAAKLLSRFAAVDNGSSGAVPLYLQRTADSFNHLVQFHSKHKMNELQNYPDLERVQKLWRDRVSNNNDNGENENPQDTTEPNLDEGNKKYSKIGQKSDKKMPEVINLENGVPEQEKRERKKRKIGKFDAVDNLQSEKKNKKRRTEDCEWKAQAGNICVASFDWSCSGICNSADRIKEVHRRCGEDCSLRMFVVPLSVASIWLTVTNQQDNSIYGNLEYSNFIGLKYMVCISAISAGYALFTVASSWVRCLVNKTWLFFVSDQVLAYLMVTSMAATVEFLYLAYNGDQEVSWSEACGTYGKFCNRLKLALALYVIAVCCLLVLAVISAFRFFRRFEPPFLPSKDAAQERT